MEVMDEEFSKFYCFFISSFVNFYENFTKIFTDFVDFMEISIGFNRFS